MKYQRQTWQHIFEGRSEDQLKDAFKSVGWVVERLRHDYGEDLFARPFENGNPTGNDFFIQLKGTDNVEQYHLRDKQTFSYPIELVNLMQWYSFTLPVILIIWDITSRIGFWLHVQPFIKQKLEINPNWLENKSGAKDPTRKIRIPSYQFVKEQNLDTLKPAIETEWRKIKKAKNHFEILYQANVDISEEYDPDLPSAIKRQLQLTELMAVVTVKPQKPQGWLNLAVIHYKMNDLNEALKAINQAWKLDSEDSNIRQVRACVLAEYAIRNGTPASMLHEAITIFQTISETSDTLKNYNIGNCYGALGECKKAIEYYDKSLSTASDSKLAASIWTNRGNVADDLGRRDDAIQSFKNSIKFNPSLWNAYASWAALEVRHENFESACEHFCKALKYNSELKNSGDNLLYWYAYSLHQIGKYREALHIINQLLDVHPVHEEGLIAKVHILYELRRIDKAFVDEALAFNKQRLIDNPADMIARSELNFIYLAENRADDRRKLLEETVTFDNVPALALYHYSVLLEEDGELDEAMYYLEQAANKDKNHLIVHTLARLKRETGHYLEAIKFYKLAIYDVDDPLPILEKISDCYYFLDDYKSCVVVISQALLLGKQVEGQWWNNLYVALNELGIEPSKYDNFLTQNIYSGESLSEVEIRAKLDLLMKPINDFPPTKKG
ncbi:MAG: DUF4365 domain-containing protein [Gammaproteobacteria bacterium]|nr:DUF4365 domain-containing protein [Gammaproteobacteria bacterium]